VGKAHGRISEPDADASLLLTGKPRNFRSLGHQRPRFNATSFAAYIASGGLVSPEAKVPGAPVVGGTVMIAKGLYLTMH
jgi:hypothetical protein